MKASLAIAFILGAFAMAGTMEFNDKLAAAEERAQRKAPRPATQEEARIWSAKCERKGRQIIATQADGGKWLLRCVNANLKV